MNDLASHPDLASVRPHDASEDLDQRGFSGSVLAEERAHFPGRDAEVHPCEGERPRIGLRAIPNDKHTGFFAEATGLRERRKIRH